MTEEMVRLHLSKINVNKSCGPVEVHPRMLFELANIIAEPVAFLFNLIFEQEILPKDWKLAFVSPIFKKGSRSVAENYRPISLTSIVCNVMESFVKGSVRKHLMMNNLLSKKQYGFINGRSTTTQLLYYLDNCISTEGGVIDTIYLDFANLPTLAYRKLRSDLIEIYKHFHHYDIETISTTFQPRERVTRKHAFQLLERNVKDGSRGIQSNSFYYRPTRAWNNLPKTVVDTKSINSFKNRLDKHMSKDRVMFDHTINIERLEA